MGVRDGKHLQGGNWNYISGQIRIAKEEEAELQKQAEVYASEGKTPLFFAEDGKILGMVAVADVMKEDSPEAIAELKNMGIHVVMLTGDNEQTAQAIGKQAGVDEVIAGVLPDGKEAVIANLQKKGKVAMVGDGVNDAPALTCRYGYRNRSRNGYCHRRGRCRVDEEPVIRCTGSNTA